MFVLFTVGFAIALHASIQRLDGSGGALSETFAQSGYAYEQFQSVSKSVSALENQQADARANVVDTTQLEQQLSAIQIDIQVGHSTHALFALGQLEERINSTKKRLASISPDTGHIATTERNIPILIFHYTPSNFNAQLNELQHKGYTAINMSQLANALLFQTPLPPKAVAITFDDGFSGQMAAYKDLKAHHMVATYYIIAGGARSKWCIGAGRRSHDPLQPKTGCGDSYLTWDQVKQMDRSGVVIIGAHTVDHENLATEPPDEQRFQIFDGKHQIESHLGHAVKDFAYPYGGFTATTIKLVREVGFTTAVTTTPGTMQSASNLYTLRRVREVSELP